MARAELTAFTQAFAAGGAALRAAQLERDGWEVRRGELIITGPVLRDKTLRQIEAGRRLPDRITLSFGETADLIRYLTLVVKHMDQGHPLVADHPAFTPSTAEDYEGWWP